MPVSRNWAVKESLKWLKAPFQLETESSRQILLYHKGRRNNKLDNYVGANYQNFVIDTIDEDQLQVVGVLAFD